MRVLLLKTMMKLVQQLKILNQENLARCSSTASASNIINLVDIKCKTANITDNKQQAYAESILTCTINQDLVNELSTSIVNKIDKNFSRMYDAAKDDDSRKKVAALKQAVGELLRNMSGLPYNSEENKPVNNQLQESSSQVDKKEGDVNDNTDSISDKSKDVFGSDDNKPEKPSMRDSKEQDSVVQVPVEQVPVEQKSAEQEPVNQVPVNQGPVEQKPVEQEPTEQKSVNQDTVEQKPIENQNKSNETENNMVTFMGYEMTKEQMSITITVIIVLLIVFIGLIYMAFINKI